MTVAEASTWPTVGILDLVTIASGQVDPRLPEFRDLPLVAPDHIESGTGRLVSLKSASQLGAISGKYLVEPGDVIYSKIRPNLRKAHLATFRALCSADMYPLRPKPGVSPEFLLNVLLSASFTKFAVSASMRSGIPKINRAELAEYELPRPSRGEQREIGRALADADALIRSLERVHAKKQDIKQGMMQGLLTGRARIPGFSSEWKPRVLGDVSSVDPESLSPATTASSEEIDYVALEDVSRGALLGSSRYQFGAAPSRARRKIRSRDVLFGTVRPNLQSHTIYRGGLRNPVASTGFAVIRSRSGVTDPDFIAQWVLSGLVMSQVERIIAGSNYPAVSTADVRKFDIHLPEVEEQRAIGVALTDADSEVAALERRLESARAIKTGMMQELLTGRTRLPVEVTS